MAEIALLANSGVKISFFSIKSPFPSFGESLSHWEVPGIDGVGTILRGARPARGVIRCESFSKSSQFPVGCLDAFNAFQGALCKITNDYGAIIIAWIDLVEQTEATQAIFSADNDTKEAFNLHITRQA